MSHYDMNEGTMVKAVRDIVAGDELVEGDGFILQVTKVEALPRGMFRLTFSSSWTIMPVRPAVFAGRRMVRTMGKRSGFYS